MARSTSICSSLPEYPNAKRIIAKNPKRRFYDGWREAHPVPPRLTAP
jgi:hypothetical protein